MKKIFKFLLLTFFLISTLIPLRSEMLKLDLEEAKQIALNNNSEIKMARQQVEKAQAQVTQARSRFLPQVNAFSSFQHSWALGEQKMRNFLKPTLAPLYTDIGDAFQTLGQQTQNQDLIQQGKNLARQGRMMPDYMSMSFGIENTATYGLKLQQPLFRGGTIWNSYQSAKLRKEMAQSKLRSKKNELLTKVKSAYYQTLLAKLSIDVSKQALEFAKENLQNVKKFYEQGKVTKLDKLRANVQVSNFKPQLITAQNQLKRSKTNLTIILGLKKETDLTLTDSLKFKRTPLLDRSLEELIQIAIKNRPEMKTVEIQKKLSRNQIQVAKGAFLPNISLGTTYQYQGMRNDLNYGWDDFDKSFNTSISLSIPIFTGFKRTSKIEEAQVSLNSSKEQKRSVQDKIRMDVKNSYYSLQEAYEKVQAQELTIKQAKEALRLAQLQYSEGAATQLEVIDANLSYKKAKMNYHQSLMKYNTAKANLKKAINKL